MVDSAWSLPLDLVFNCPDIASEILQTVTPKFEASDQLVRSLSTSGELTFKSVYLHLSQPKPPILWSKLIWCSFIPPSKSFVSWRLIHDRMPTDEHLWSKGIIVISMCSLCLCTAETSRHLFLDCIFARRL